MSAPIITPSGRRQVLIVDDEPDIHAVTKLSLRSLRHADQKLRLLSAHSGAEALQTMREQPDIAVVLLDVVMETDSAGLDACRAIREELHNPFARILLRTGQPGSAPEKETIDGYDIDGYLPKAELTTSRLYTAVRTALRAWEQLVSLARHRRYLAKVHEHAVSLHSFDDLGVSLGRILDGAVEIHPSELAVLHLETFEEAGNPQIYTLHTASGPSADVGEAAASRVASHLARDAAAQSMTGPAMTGPTAYEEGFLLPLSLHRELGFGWIYLKGEPPDELATMALQMLCAHAKNGLYSSVAERMLKAQQGPVFDSMAI